LPELGNGSGCVWVWVCAVWGGGTRATARRARPPPCASSSPSGVGAVPSWKASVRTMPSTSWRRASPCLHRYHACRACNGKREGQASGARQTQQRAAPATRAFRCLHMFASCRCLSNSTVLAVDPVGEWTWLSGAMAPRAPSQTSHALQCSDPASITSAATQAAPVAPARSRAGPGRPQPSLTCPARPRPRPGATSRCPRASAAAGPAPTRSRRPHVPCGRRHGQAQWAAGPTLGPIAHV
jgi:hypothetical protein